MRSLYLVLLVVSLLGLTHCGGGSSDSELNVAYFLGSRYRDIHPGMTIDEFLDRCPRGAIVASRYYPIAAEEDLDDTGSRFGWIHLEADSSRIVRRIEIAGEGDPETCDSYGEFVSALRRRFFGFPLRKRGGTWDRLWAFDDFYVFTEGNQKFVLEPLDEEAQYYAKIRNELLPNDARASEFLRDQLGEASSTTPFFIDPIDMVTHCLEAWKDGDLGPLLKHQTVVWRIAGEHVFDAVGPLESQFHKYHLTDFRVGDSVSQYGDLSVHVVLEYKGKTYTRNPHVRMRRVTDDEIALAVRHGVSLEPGTWLMRWRKEW